MVGAAYAESSQGVVASAMEAWGKVNRAYPDRDMIRTPAFTGDLDASIHNEISLMWAGAWMLESGLAVATIATYLSLIKTNLGAHLGWRLTCPQSEVRLPRFLQRPAPAAADGCAGGGSGGELTTTVALGS